MKYCTYINQSQKTGKYYIGHCKDYNKRLGEHNSGKVRSTKSGIPWKVVLLEYFNNKREQQIKSYKGGEAFKKLISTWRDGRVVECGSLENC